MLPKCNTIFSSLDIQRNANIAKIKFLIKMWLTTHVKKDKSQYFIKQEIKYINCEINALSEDILERKDKLRKVTGDFWSKNIFLKLPN